MHICLVTRSFDTSKNTFSDFDPILSLAKYLVKFGHTVTLISWKPSFQEQDSYEEDGLTVEFLGLDNFKSIKEFSDLTLTRLKEIHQANPIQIVHSFDTQFKNFYKYFSKKPFALSFGIESTSMLDVFTKYSKTYSGDLNALFHIFSSTFYFLKKYFVEDYSCLKLADGFFVSSPKEILALDRYYLYPQIKSFQIPLNLASGYFPKREKNESLMEKLFLEPNSQILVARDSFDDFKQTEFLLYAFEKVAIKKPRAKMLIIGDGPYFKKAERVCLELALDSRVQFLGKLSKKVYLDYVNLGDIFIHLSGHASGLGVALLEAMSQEKIVIGSEFSPISNIITDHVNGLLIRPGESEQLVKMIIDIFENPSAYQEFGRQARAKVIETLDRKQLALNALNAFQKIIQQRS